MSTILTISSSIADEYFRSMKNDSFKLTKKDDKGEQTIEYVPEFSLKNSIPEALNAIINELHEKYGKDIEISTELYTFLSKIAYQYTELGSEMNQLLLHHSNIPNEDYNIYL